MKKNVTFILALLSGVTMAQTTNPSPYCAANYSDDFMNVAHAIERVEFGTLDNFSGSTQSPLPHYLFYNNLTPSNFLIGNYYELKITHSDGTTIHGIAAWIDFNGDDEFQSNEKVGESLWPGDDNIGTSNTLIYNVTIPSYANIGNTRMRVRLYEDDDYTFSGNDLPVLPCQYGADVDYDWGEAEDYTIILSNTSSILEQNNKKLDFTFENNNLTIKNTDFDKIFLTDLNGKSLLVSNENKINLDNFSDGIYFIQVNLKNNEFIKIKIVK